MRKSSFKVEFDKFLAEMDQHTDLLIKIIKSTKITLSPNEEKVISPKLSSAEKKQIHEAFVLKICATWEILAENVFVECLSQDTSKYAAQKGITLPKKLTKNTCKGLVSGFRYFDCGDISSLRGKAGKFLADRKNPFKEISRNVTTKINEFYKIRNYIAHRSSTAEQALKKMYKETYEIDFRTPGDFLFDIVTFFESGERGKSIRFASYSYAFEKAADEMATFLYGIEPRLPQVL